MVFAFKNFIDEELSVIMVPLLNLKMDFFDYLLILILIFINEVDTPLPEEVSEKDQSELEEKMI